MGSVLVAYASKYGSTREVAEHIAARLRSAVFGLGPLEDTPEQFEGARQHLDKGLAKHDWLHPSAVAIFGGKLEPSGLRFPDNNPAMRGMGPLDLRDFAAIEAWADSLPDALGLSDSPGS